MKFNLYTSKFYSEKCPNILQHEKAILKNLVLTKLKKIVIFAFLIDIDMRIRECCDGMRIMIRENTFCISNISQKGWMKVIEHDGTMELGNEPKLHNYDITHCPFCGVKIEENMDPINESDFN
jgi:predicted nucleic acid-binding Zn ribbon protein